MTYESCFKTTNTELASNNHQLVLGVDLGRSYFMHAILAVQDFFTGWEAYAHQEFNEYFQNFRIYIGDDEDWSKNTECAGGPFLTLDEDSDGWYDDPLLGSTDKGWTFGKEVWCNLEGRYMHVIADLSHLLRPPYD